MLGLADELGARVRGDELETYRTPTETYRHRDDDAQRASDEALVSAMKRRQRIRQWGLNIAVFGFLALLAILVRALSG